MNVAALSKLCVANRSLTLAALTPTTAPLAAQRMSLPARRRHRSPACDYWLFRRPFCNAVSCLPPVSASKRGKTAISNLRTSLGAFAAQAEQLYAQCLPVDPAMEDEDAELVWEVHPDGTLVASVEAAPPQRIELTGALVALAPSLEPALD